MKSPHRACLAVAVIAALAVSLGALASRAVAKKEAVAGVVIDLQGKPTIKSPGEKQARKLKDGESVYKKDVVKTGPKERVAIAFIGGAELRINENSEFVMEEGGGHKEVSVFTQAGNAWTRLMSKSAVGKGMRVGSPLAVAAVRGTEGDFDVTAKSMVAKCYEGHCTLGNEFGKSPCKAGQMSQVTGPGMAPEPCRKMGKEEFGSWQNSLSPKDLEEKLKRLNKEAEENKTMEIKYDKKDGSKGSLKLKLKKK